MQRTDGNYLYTLGRQLQPLHDVSGGDTLYSAFAALIWAETALDPFLHNSIYKLRHSLQSGENLLWWVTRIKDKAMASSDFQNETVDVMDANNMKAALATFETNLAAEFAQLPTYLVAKKGGYDTSDLIENGTALFHPELSLKVPEAVSDIEQATRCIAFEVPTAAGFHLHRANEAVIKRYFNAVCGTVPPPKTEGMGTYLATMRDNAIGDQRVLAALRDLKDLHRNPLVHPGQSLESVEEAIDLLAAIRAAIGHMLKAIPRQPTLEEFLGSAVPAADAAVAPAIEAVPDEDVIVDSDAAAAATDEIAKKFGGEA